MKAPSALPWSPLMIAWATSMLNVVGAYRRISCGKRPPATNRLKRRAGMKSKLIWPSDVCQLTFTNTCSSPVYLIVSRWTSEEAFGAFVQSDAFKKVTNWGKENILSRRPSHTTYSDG